MLDTLDFARKMEAAGMERRTAEALAGELNQSFRQNLATRSDLETEAHRLKADIEAATSRVTGTVVATVAAMLLAHFVAVWFYVGTKFETHQREMNARFDAAQRDINARFDNQNARFDEQSAKFEAIQRELGAISAKLGPR